MQTGQSNSVLLEEAPAGVSESSLVESNAAAPSVSGAEGSTLPDGTGRLLLVAPEGRQTDDLAQRLRSAGFQVRRPEGDAPFPVAKAPAADLRDVVESTAAQDSPGGPESEEEAWLVDVRAFTEAGLPPLPERSAESPILLIADPAALGDADQLLRFGGDDVICLPVDPEELRLRLRLARRLARRSVDASRAQFTLLQLNAELKQANMRMRDELEAAKRVQQALLPQRHFRAPGTRLAWHLEPSAELAGDILNFIRVDEHHLAFYVIDVCGHGVSSALLGAQVARMMSPMMTESTLLKEPLQEKPWYRLVEPSRVLSRLNAQFQAAGNAALYFTMVYGVLHVASGRLRVAGAGHPPLILTNLQGRQTRIDCSGLPIGLFDEAEYRETELQVRAGDRIWGYSDGLTEAEAADGREFGLERLERLIVDHREAPLDQAVAGTTENVALWCHPRRPADDCSLLAVEVL